jgi:uncharacterized protein YukE
MAVVGEAHVIVRAITNRVRPDIQKAFEGLDGVGEAAGRDISDSFNRGLSRGGGERGGLFSAKFRKEAEDARLGLQRLITTGYALAPAFTALVAVIGALGGGLLALGGIAGAVGIGGLVTLAGGLSAVAQAAITAKLAFSGVGAALQAGIKNQKGSAANDKAIAKAKRSLTDAQVKLNRLYTEAKPELLIKLGERQKDAEENLADAKIASERGERAYRDAQDKTRSAIEKLNEARDAAREKLQQLKFETEGGAIAEKRARLEFEKARESLQRVQDLPPNSRARKEAELAYAEADLNMRKAIDRNKDLKKETATAVALGVNGAKEVVAAEKAKNDAQLDEMESAQDLARTKTQQAKAQEALNKAVADYKDPASSKEGIELNRRIADARRDVVDAQEALNEAQKGPGADAFADAMANLSPEAQKFVKYLMSIQGEFKKLKAAAGQELFPKLETAIQNLVDNLFPKLIPLLQGTGGVIGQMAIDFSNAVTEGDRVKTLESVWKTNDELLGKVGLAAGNFYGGLLDLLDAAKPLIDGFGDWILKLSETFEKTMAAKKATGELTTFFKNIKRITGGLGKAFSTAFSSLGDIIGNVVAPGGAGDIFVTWLQNVTQGWKDFTSGGAENDGLTSFLNGAITNLTKVLDIIGVIIGDAAKLGASPEFGLFLDKIKVAFEIFGSLGESLKTTLPIAGDLAIKFAEFTKLLTDSGAIEIFLGTLDKIFGVLNAIFGNSIVQKVLGFVGGVFAVVRAFTLVSKAGKFVFQGIIGSILNVQNKFTSLKNFIKDPFGALRKGSGLTRTELTKQMTVDAQKKKAMEGIFISGKQAASGINLVDESSKRVRPTMKSTADLIRTKFNSAITGVKTAADKAKVAMTNVGTGASTLSAKLRASAAGSKIKAGALKGIGTAGRIAGAGMKAAGRGLGALFGGPIGIILLLLPLIIENWDAIVAFFKDLIPKLGKIFSDMWSGLTTFLGEAWTNITTWFTQTFIPGLGNFFMKALELIALILFPLPTLLIKFWPEISGFFTNTVFPWFAALPGKILEIAGKVWNFLSDTAKNAWGAVTGWWTGTVVPWFTGLAGKVFGFAGKVWNFLSDGLKTGWNAAVTFFTTTIPNYLKSLPSKFATALKGLWDGIAGGLKFAWEAAKQWWNQNVASKKLKIGGFKILGVQIPQISLGFPPLAKGGIIPATPGGMLAQIGEAGQAERVEPLDANGLSKRDKAMIDYMSGGAGGGITIVVNPSAGMDERELADLVSRKLAQTMRRGAA